MKYGMLVVKLRAQLCPEVLRFWLTLTLKKRTIVDMLVKMSQARVTKPLNYFTICFNACFSLSGTI